MAERIIVHLVYLDDSRRDRDIQIVCAVIIRDDAFDFIEQHFGYTISEAVPPAIRAGPRFEFHASDMFHGNDIWRGFSRDKAIEVMATALDAMDCLNGPCVTYGSVNLGDLEKGLFGSANPVDVAFRCCCLAIEEWFRKYAPGELAVFISDDTKNHAVKNAMRDAFRAFRPKVRSSPLVRGILDHALDDIYFGHSHDSVGIQLADICAFIIRRHLAGNYADTADLYDQLKPRLYPGRHAFDQSSAMMGA
jgi:uncharacterized protein DUF3800